MATTLKLVDTVKIDTRRNGEISYIDVRVVLDGVEVNANFRARVGEEPIVIDGDTITVSDAQVASKRQAIAIFAQQDAQRAAQQAAAIKAARAKLEGHIVAKAFSADCAADLRAAFDAAGAAVTLDAYDADYRAYSTNVRAIIARHAG